MDLLAKSAESLSIFEGCAAPLQLLVSPPPRLCTSAGVQSSGLKVLSLGFWFRVSGPRAFRVRDLMFSV